MSKINKTTKRHSNVYFNVPTHIICIDVSLRRPVPMHSTLTYIKPFINTSTILTQIVIIVL